MAIFAKVTASTRFLSVHSEQCRIGACKLIINRRFIKCFAWVSAIHTLSCRGLAKVLLCMTFRSFSKSLDSAVFFVHISEVGHMTGSALHFLF